MANVAHKRGTRANLDTATTSSGLITGQLYWCTDTSELFIATAVNAKTLVTVGKQDKHGFPNRTDSTLSFVDATRTFSITGTNFIVFNIGSSQTKNTENIVISNTKGTHYIYYNSSNILVASTTPWTIGIDIPISIVIWNGTNALLCEERHGLFDIQTHKWAHSVFHTLYASGLSGTFTNTTFNIDSGIIFDEDIEIAIPTTTSSRVFYRDTGGASFTWTASQTNYNLISGTMYYDNAGTLTAVSSANFIAIWVYGTDIVSNGIIFVLGQRQDATIANARANNTPGSIATANLPPEFKLLYRVLVKNDATPYQETTDYRATSVTGTSVTVTDHQTLSNRSAIDSHPINAITGLTNAGAGTLFLADDGTYKSAGNVAIHIQLGFSITGSATPSTGYSQRIRVPRDCTITGWEIVSKQTGSVQLDIKKSDYTGYPTTTSIVAAAPPSVTTAGKATSSTLTGWTTALTEGNWIEFWITSVTTFTEFTFVLKVQ